MDLDELMSLNITQIEIALTEQRTLYNDEEIAQLNHRLTFLKNNPTPIQEKGYLKGFQNINTFVCPKCEGINDFMNTQCSYCGYSFKEKDYLDSTISSSDSNVETQHNFILYLISLFFPLIGSIIGLIYILKDDGKLGAKLILFSIICSIIITAVIIAF